jgi:hypothetical protein
MLRSLPCSSRGACSVTSILSPILALHEHFLHSISCTLEEEDASNKPLDVQTQLL